MSLFQLYVRMSDSSVGRACNNSFKCIYAHGFEPSLCLFYICFFTKFWIILSYSIKFKAWISMKSVEFDTVHCGYGVFFRPSGTPKEDNIVGREKSQQNFSN